jgi:hypothetical protein
VAGTALVRLLLSLVVEGPAPVLEVVLSLGLGTVLGGGDDVAVLVDETRLPVGAADDVRDVIPGPTGGKGQFGVACLFDGPELVGVPRSLLIVEILLVTLETRVRADVVGRDSREGEYYQKPSKGQ